VKGCGYSGRALPHSPPSGEVKMKRVMQIIGGRRWTLLWIEAD